MITVTSAIRLVQNMHQARVEGNSAEAPNHGSAKDPNPYVNGNVGETQSHPLPIDDHQGELCVQRAGEIQRTLSTRLSTVHRQSSIQSWPPSVQSTLKGVDRWTDKHGGLSTGRQWTEWTADWTRSWTGGNPTAMVWGIMAGQEE